MALAYIGLGTNLGSKEDNLKNTIRQIQSNDVITIVKESSILETDPVDFLDQPQFLNQIILIETDLNPHELLILLQNIENQMGRKRVINKGPRLIDLDILLYDESVIMNKDLRIPHPEIRNREFILKHLVELSPELSDPETKMLYNEFLKS